MSDYDEYDPNDPNQPSPGYFFAPEVDPDIVQKAGIATAGGLYALSRPYIRTGLGVTLKEIASGSKIMTLGAYNSILKEALSTNKKLQYEKLVGKKRAKMASRDLINTGIITKKRGELVWKAGRKQLLAARREHVTGMRSVNIPQVEAAQKEIRAGRKLYVQGIELEAMGQSMIRSGKVKALQQKALSLGRRGKLTAKGTVKAGVSGGKTVLSGAKKIIKSPVTGATAGRVARKVLKKAKRRGGYGSNEFGINFKTIARRIKKKTKVVKKKADKVQKRKGRTILTRTADEFPVWGLKTRRTIRRRF